MVVGRSVAEANECGGACPPVLSRGISGMWPENNPHRSGEDRQIQSGPAVPNVIQVTRNLVGRRSVIPWTDLRPTSDTGPHCVTVVIMRDRLSQLGDDLWPSGSRANEAHIPAQNIDHLREFIQPNCADKPYQATQPALCVPAIF